jgi:hypothetical protein
MLPSTTNHNPHTGSILRFAYDRFGSLASDRHAADGRGMSASPPIADVRRDDAWLAASFRFSINDTADGPIGFSHRSPRHGFTQTRRASDTKAASRHLPPGSGDVGPDERAGPVHEVQERLVLRPSRASVPPAIADIMSSLLVDYPVRQQTTKVQIETKLCRSALS